MHSSNLKFRKFILNNTVYPLADRSLQWFGIQNETNAYSSSNNVCTNYFIVSKRRTKICTRYKNIRTKCAAFCKNYIIYVRYKNVHYFIFLKIRKKNTHQYVYTTQLSVQVHINRFSDQVKYSAKLYTVGQKIANIVLSSGAEFYTAKNRSLSVV